MSSVNNPGETPTGGGAAGTAGLRTVASYETYQEAQRAVDFLSDEGFPVQHVSIVGTGLRYVEQVTGRRRYGRAAAEGAASGAVIGALIGFLFGLFSLVDPLVSGLVLALWGLVFGAVIGALAGAAAHATTRGQRDFSSQSGFRASRFDVMVGVDRADEAERRLTGLSRPGRRGVG